MSTHKPLLEPVYEVTPCAWTPEHPRHDHQLIFALDDEHLVLVWSEYYAIRPSQAVRTPFDSGGFGDEFPCRISAKVSTDRGRTWGATFTLQENTFSRNVKHPNLIRLKGGELLFTFVFYSDDEFETWRMSEDTMTAPGRGAHEPSIVELRDGRLLCLLRTTEGCVYRSFSADGGVHWSAPEPTPLEAPDSPPILSRIPSTGDLLVVWNNIKSRSNWPRTPLTMAISRDEGETWGGFKDIDARSDADAAYASVFFQGEEVLIAYYTRKRYWARDAEVLLRVYGVDQLYE